MAITKREADKGHPCRTPAVTLKANCQMPFALTKAHTLKYKEETKLQKSLGAPEAARASFSQPQETLGKVLSRSNKIIEGKTEAEALKEAY